MERFVSYGLAIIPTGVSIRIAPMRSQELAVIDVACSVLVFSVASCHREQQLKMTHGQLKECTIYLIIISKKRGGSVLYI